MNATPLKDSVSFPAQMIRLPFDVVKYPDFFHFVSDISTIDIGARWFSQEFLVYRFVESHILCAYLWH